MKKKRKINKGHENLAKQKVQKTKDNQELYKNRKGYARK